MVAAPVRPFAVILHRGQNGCIIAARYFSQDSHRHRQPGSLYLCAHPSGVSAPGIEVAENKVSESLTPAALAAARRDAAAMNIGWAVVWKRNDSVTKFLESYLKETGFHFAYLQKIHGKDTVLVYRRG